MQRSPPIRILSVRRSGGSNRRPAAELVNALGETHALAGWLEVGLDPAVDMLIKLSHAHPDRAVWRARAGFNERTFNALTRAAERQLHGRDGEFDVIFQFQTLFSPGQPKKRRPFVIYTDNIMSLTERFYPAWAPLSAAQFRRWQALETRVCGAAAYVLAMSDFLRDALIADYACDPARVVCVGSGAPIVSARLDLRRWDSATALFVGRDFVRKGGRFLLDAWPRVREQLPGARLIVVGPPQPAAGSDLPGVEWRGPVESQNELARLYENASAFVLPSLFEPFGHVFLEAMGCALPCIGAAHCAMPEIISDGETGLLVPPRESEPLAHALVRLLGDPSLAEALGRRAHERVGAEYRWQDVAGRITPLLAAAAAPGAGGAGVGN
jgi:glycosyltransferase involved in cell wall biosynthesis